ncbi:MAG: hypothetical protein U0802_13110 [Candidatus Binatia bacterium]
MSLELHGGPLSGWRAVLGVPGRGSRAMRLCPQQRHDREQAGEPERILNRAYGVTTCTAGTDARTSAIGAMSLRASTSTRPKASLTVSRPRRALRTTAASMPRSIARRACTPSALKSHAGTRSAAMPAFA